MKNYKLYIRPPQEPIQIKRYEGKPIAPVKKAKLEDVPQIYRHNRKMEFVDFLWMLLICAIFVLFLTFMVALS